MLKEDITFQEIVDERSLIPIASGIYIFKDKNSEVLYIGKAINLRNRLNNYITGSDDRENVKLLLPQIQFVQFIVTENDRQSIILEADFIRKFKPKYNIRLKDDKSSLYIKIDKNSQWPRLVTCRNKDDDSLYIGPFAFAYELRQLLEVIRKTIPLRTCTDQILRNRVRPCMEYEIGQCCAPCCLDVDKHEYDEYISEAIKILNGNNKEVRDSLQMQMENYSETLQYEKAATIRDRIDVLDTIASDKVLFSPSDSITYDVCSIIREGEMAEISILRIVNGRIAQSKSFGHKNVVDDTDELLYSFIFQYYMQIKEMPDQLVIGQSSDYQPELQEFLTEKKGRKVEVVVPQRGAKKRMLDLASYNARTGFNLRFREEERTNIALKDLCEALNLSQVPRVIDCVDISHIQGVATIGAVVRYVNGKWDKEKYRVYNLSCEGKPDDFAGMREVMQRHLTRNGEEGNLCDLYLIDGGPAQLSQVLKVREDLGLQSPEMAGIAKARRKYIGTEIDDKHERLFSEEYGKPVVLKEGTSLYRLVTTIRNEAHRFAITAHRKRRKNRQYKSSLEGIAGIGPARRKELLRVFGSIKSLKNADAEEIASRTSLNINLAQRVYDKLHINEFES